MSDKIRSILFNILFYGLLTPGVCILFLPAAFISHKATRTIAKTYDDLTYHLARFVMGIDYEVRGLEHKPESGAFLLGAKHQSAYETLILYRLFHDPTIILKKELLRIPFFGQFLKSLDVIAIDRSNRSEAMASLIQGVERMKKQERPIVIFPQGTRVAPNVGVDVKPYKNGIARLYSATGLPIVPLALNTGLFWPRNSFWKRRGKVILEFLPPIESGLSEQEAMDRLQDLVETHSLRLMEEAKAKHPNLADIPLLSQKKAT